MQLRSLLSSCLSKELSSSTLGRISLVCIRQLSDKTTGASSEDGQLRFDGQTAIVTGAGRGLGRQHALLLASRGANLLLNDQDEAAEQLAEEINRSHGAGKAVACRQSVACPDGAEQLASRAVDRFGSIDILINNAGILCDKSFAKMSIEDWDQVVAVHLRGSFLVTRACWPQMRAQKFGRILMTSSTSGLYGNFGQANYAAAKMALVGLSSTLAIEGAKDGIQCNVLVPMAASRMTEGLLPEPLAEKLSPALVSPLAVWLCHRKCSTTGQLFEGAGGWFGRHALVRSEGVRLLEPTIEEVRDSWPSITDTSAGQQMESFSQHLGQLMQSLDDN